MIVTPLLVFFSALALTHGCATTPGAGPPAAEKTFQIDFSPPLDWTARGDAAARKKRDNEGNGAENGGQPEEITTTTKAPEGGAGNEGQQNQATTTTKAPTGNEGQATPAPAPDSTSAPKKDDPSTHQQATVARAEKTMTRSIKNSILDAIGRSGLIVQPTITFSDIPDLKMTVKPEDVVDNTVVTKTLSLKVNVKIPYMAPDAAWKQISDATFVDLTTDYGVQVRKIQVV
ncbi:hypothetical protein QR680_011656 [Steinernema hermaphroditum]|uniref:Uncharacterized protein n=1 Tax=Steinernema hermaphroditum TaxID=289476 RepID=A0AA39I0T4_9BILA|nr:hypothetical protein QR680_011656 [Steinernema hermaphroditum]